MKRGHWDHVELAVQRGMEIQRFVIFVAKIKGDRLAGLEPRAELRFEVAKKCDLTLERASLPATLTRRIRDKRMLSRIGILLDDGSHQRDGLVDAVQHTPGDSSSRTAITITAMSIAAPSLILPFIRYSRVLC